MGQSWSGVRKRLEEDLLCENLKGRVQYFITKYKKTHDDEARVAVRVDGKEIVKGNIFTFYKEANPLIDQIKSEKNVPRRQWDGKQMLNDAVNMAVEKHVDQILTDKGNVDTYLFTEALDFYMTHTIEASLDSSDALVRMFAIMDRRVGKRRLEKLSVDICAQPNWLQYFYMLRMEAEGIRLVS